MNEHDRMLAEGPRVAPEPGMADAKPSVKPPRTVPRGIRRLAGPAIFLGVIAANSIGFDAVGAYFALFAIAVVVVLSLVRRFR